MKFHPDSPFFKFMDSLAAFIGLNVIFLITCLPVVTIGPALIALYTVTMKEARGEGGYIFSTYLKVFKDNLRRGTAAWCLLLALGLIFFYNAYFWGELNTVPGNICMFLMTALFVIWGLILLYTFPLMARFENSLRQTLKNALRIALTNVKATLGILGILAACILLCLGVPQYAKVFMILVGFSFFAYCNSMIFVRVFRNYE